MYPYRCMVMKVERRNNVSISVYGYEFGKKDLDGFVSSLKVSIEVKGPHVDMLLNATDDTNYYCKIKEVGKLVGSQYSNHTHKAYFCRFCLNGFSRSYEARDR